VRSNYPIINVYKKKNIKSEVVTQILYGETFKKIKKIKSWFKIKNNLDSYSGYIKSRKYPVNHSNTHKVCTLSSNLYSKPKNKNKLKLKLSFGSKINISDKNNNFYKFDKFWIKKKDVKKINYTSKGLFKDINKFKNVKYKWGGKNYKGIDCSGLIQLFLNFNNKYCPRDSTNQLNFFKKNIKLSNIKKDDLIFWKGHVALALSKKQAIHAYGPYKKVVIMPIKKMIRKIYSTANLKVIGIKRI